MDARVRTLKSIEFTTPQPETATAFFSTVWGLEVSAHEGGCTYFRGTGPEHHLLAVREADGVACSQLTFGATNRAEVNALAARVKAGFPHAGFEPPGELPGPARGYGFSFTDGSGMTYSIVSETLEHEVVLGAVARPFKLSHVVVNLADVDAMTAAFVELLGFRVRDRMNSMDFLGCGPDHHSLAFCRFGKPGFGHVAFEMPTLDDFMIGANRVINAGYPLEWGFGRHGPGANIFAYFLAPDGYVVEFTSDFEQVDDSTHIVHGADYWAQAENREKWGLAKTWSASMGEAQSGLIPFRRSRVP